MNNRGWDKAKQQREKLPVRLKPLKQRRSITGSLADTRAFRITVLQMLVL